MGELMDFYTETLKKLPVDIRDQMILDYAYMYGLKWGLAKGFHDKCQAEAKCNEWLRERSKDIQDAMMGKVIAPPTAPRDNGND